MEPFTILPATTNQAAGIARYAVEFLHSAQVDPAVWSRLELFHLDSQACAVSALALKANAPTVLRQEALTYRANPPGGAFCLGSRRPVRPEKCVVANSSAAREWDANGTNFGYNPARAATKGEFGHNDFYPVCIAAAQHAGLDGTKLARGMLALDEIRGRLAEVFSLKEHKIDHVLHGAIASAAVYGAMLGGSIEQIERAIGMVVAHYVPFRAIRAGEQLSDSKGASAAFAAETAVMCAQRTLGGFLGPLDIFRNPEAVFCRFAPPKQPGHSPFELALATGGADFSLMSMHFKLGLYEHQSAGAIQALIQLVSRHGEMLASVDSISSIRVRIYQPAFGIIADPAKRHPETRQSADHSLYFIVASVLKKAVLKKAAMQKCDRWEDLMLLPADYSDAAIHDPLIRRIMQRIELEHGGAAYDQLYPEGIPTSVQISHETLGELDSGLIMFPAGHAKNTSHPLEPLLDHKVSLLAGEAVEDFAQWRRKMTGLLDKSVQDVAAMCDFQIRNVERD